MTVTKDDILAQENKASAADKAYTDYLQQMEAERTIYFSKKDAYLGLVASGADSGTVQAAKDSMTSQGEKVLAMKDVRNSLLDTRNSEIINLAQARREFDPAPVAPTTPPIVLPPADAAIDAQADEKKRKDELMEKVSESGNIGSFNKTAVGDSSDNVFATVNTITAQAKSGKLAGSPPSTSSGNEGDVPYSTEELRVTITSTVNPGDVVTLNVSPTIAEARSASYSATDILHHPGAMQIYRSTSARTYGITAMLISRNAEEAQTNLDLLNLIRSWVMPYYGSGTEQDEQANSSGSRFGAPPDVLSLTAYGPSVIGPVPCVLTQYTWTWPNEVTYIKATNGNPFPAVINLTIDLVESYSPKEYSNFTLSSYKNGDLANAFPVISKVAGR